MCRQELTLDPAGNVVDEQARSYTGAVLLTLTRVYDTLGRLQQVTDGELNSTTFGKVNQAWRRSDQKK